ncbi:MAG: hypothetical protein DHS20C18_10860 [Saprospiraceae bacterium]|nr:MAG: hypothetical protein DHS20C18_10860 [Saprospiraceae bacterium]
MKYLLLSLMFGLFLQFTTHAQVKPKPLNIANKPAKFTNNNPLKTKTKTKPKDKKMGLGVLRRPESIENNDVANAYSSLDQESWETAIDQLDDFSESDPDAAFGLGFAYYQEGEIDNAIAAFEQAVELDPNNTDALFGLGLIYVEQDNYEKAEEKFIEVLSIDPEDAEAWYELAFLYLDSGYYEEASMFFENVLLINPDDPDAPYELSRLHAINGNTEAALSSLEMAFKNGFEDATFVLEDPDLEEVRSTETFAELMNMYFPD